MSLYSLMFLLFDRIVCNLGEIFLTNDLLRRQKRLNNSDVNLNVNNNSASHRLSNDSNKVKRQKSTKARVLLESSSLLSLPSAFFSSTLTNESAMTLVGSVNQSGKRLLPDETGGDADDESIDINRYYRYNQRNVTSDEEGDDVLGKNHSGIMDFMDRVRLNLISRKD